VTSTLLNVEGGGVEDTIDAAGEVEEAGKSLISIEEDSVEEVEEAEMIDSFFSS
jgi:hypothetical protein